MDGDTIKEFMKAIQFPENRVKLNERVEKLMEQWEKEDRETELSRTKGE